MNKIFLIATLIFSTIANAKVGLINRGDICAKGSKKEISLETIIDCDKQATVELPLELWEDYQFSGRYIPQSFWNLYSELGNYAFRYIIQFQDAPQKATFLVIYKESDLQEKDFLNSLETYLYKATQKPMRLSLGATKVNTKFYIDFLNGKTKQWENAFIIERKEILSSEAAALFPRWPQIVKSYRSDSKDVFIAKFKELFPEDYVSEDLIYYVRAGSSFMETWSFPNY